MKNKLEIEDFITIHNVKSELLFLFQEVLNNNSEKDLDLIDKNISINVNNINYIFSNYTFLIFSVPILKNDSVIGFYSLEYDDSGKVIDDFFEILDNELSENFNFWIFKKDLEKTIHFLNETFSIQKQIPIEEILFQILQTDENFNVDFKLVKNSILEIKAFRDSNDSDIFFFNIKADVEVNSNFELIENYLKSLK